MEEACVPKPSLSPMHNTSATLFHKHHGALGSVLAQAGSFLLLGIPP